MIERRVSIPLEEYEGMKNKIAKFRTEKVSMSEYDCIYNGKNKVIKKLVERNQALIKECKIKRYVIRDLENSLEKSYNIKEKSKFKIGFIIFMRYLVVFGGLFLSFLSHFEYQTSLWWMAIPTVFLLGQIVSDAE